MRATPDLEVQEGGGKRWHLYVGCAVSVRTCERLPKNCLTLPTQTPCRGLSCDIPLCNPHKHTHLPKATHTNMTTTTLWPATPGGDGEDTDNGREAYEGRLQMG